MATITIRNLPDDLHRALRMRAARNGRSTAAEVRQILASAINPPQPVHMGTALAELGRDLGLTTEDLNAIERDRRPAEPFGFE